MMVSPAAMDLDEIVSTANTATSNSSFSIRFSSEFQKRLATV